MLSNKDFVEIFSQTQADSKVRFDHKQIAAWDKQNEDKARRLKQGKKISEPVSQDATDGVDRNGTSYRDRALERRKDIRPAELLALESMVSKLDAEQTKFLGGDIDHTYLVKGLDYALLHKIRNESIKTEVVPIIETSSPEFVVPTSILGNKIREVLHSRRARTPVGRVEGRKPFSSVSFEFMLGNDDIFEDQIPSVVSTALQDSHPNDRLSYIVDKSILDKLSSHCRIEHRSKRLNVEAKLPPSAEIAVAPTSIPRHLDIYEGILDETHTVSGSSSSCFGFGHDGSSVQGLFSDHLSKSVRNVQNQQNLPSFTSGKRTIDQSPSEFEAYGVSKYDEKDSDSDEEMTAPKKIKLGKSHDADVPRRMEKKDSGPNRAARRAAGKDASLY